VVNTVALAWDGATLIVIIAGLVYVDNLRRAFRGGKYGREFRYYTAAAAVLGSGYAIRVILDALNVSTTSYGLSVRDPALIISIGLLVLGLREATKFWQLNIRGKTA
jgi:hypothetical protein